MRVLYALLIIAVIGVLVYLGTADHARPKPAGKTPSGPATILKAGSVKLSDYKGKVVLLDFWATWCGPCRAALPHTQELANSADVKAGKLVVLAVNVEEATEATTVRKFIAKEGYTFPVLLDSDTAIASQFSFSGIPTFVILDRAGKKVFQQTGADADALNAAVQQALAAQ